MGPRRQSRTPMSDPLTLLHLPILRPLPYAHVYVRDPALRWLMQNVIRFGDNLPILQTMPSESAGLIYIDPPFNTKKVQSRTQIKTVRSENGDRTGFQG